MLDVTRVHPTVLRLSACVPKERVRELLSSQRAELDRQKRERPFLRRLLLGMFDRVFDAIECVISAYFRLRLALAPAETKRDWMPLPILPEHWYEAFCHRRGSEEDLIGAFAIQFSKGWLDFLNNQAHGAFFQDGRRVPVPLDKEDLLPPTIRGSDASKDVQPLLYLERLTRGVCTQEELWYLLRGFAGGVRRELRSKDQDLPYGHIIVRFYAGALYLVPVPESAPA